MTALETYQLFLQGIRKGRTRTFPPELFNSFINQVARDWLKGKINEFQLNSKRIDDIDMLYVKTDGIDYPEIPISNYINEVSVFEYPGDLISESRKSINHIPHIEVSESFYPLSFRVIQVIVNINGKPVECTYLDSHKSLDNKYQKPSEEIVYYELSKNKIRIYALERISKIQLNYIRYPRPYFFNPSNPNVDSDNPDTSSVPFEFGDEQVDEIVNNAVRAFLERSADKRYQTFLNEEKIKSVNN